MEKVGLIGFGTMGAAAGRRIVDAGYALVVYDPSEKAAKNAADLGAEVVRSASAVGERCGIAVLFLPGPAEIRGCVAGDEGLLKSMPAGGLIVDHSTVDPETSVGMMELAAPGGIGYLDAPVLGRPSAAGKWTLPIGGGEADLDRCRGLLECYAGKLIHVGACGSGNKIKLLNQMMFAAINAMTAEMLAVADRMGIEHKVLYDTIVESRAATVSNLFVELGRKVLEESYQDTTFTVDLLCKDTRLAIETAKGHHALPLLAQLVQYINESARLQGFGGSDTAVMWKVFQKMWQKSATE